MLLIGVAARLSFDVRRLERFDLRDFCREESDSHVERGEALLHGVPLAGVARAMPFYSVPNAVLCHRLTPSAAGHVLAAVRFASAFLVFELGAFLYSGLCGAGAAFLYILLPLSAAAGERWLYSLTVLFVAYFLVRRARAPSSAASALLGASLGASLLVLSPLFLFPFLLAAYEWGRDRKSGAARVRDAAALCLIPFLFLLPWIVMNARLSGRFVVFEDGRADNNIITGALGRVRTTGFSYSRAQLGIPARQSVLAWAAGEILRHPLRYLGAVFARAFYVAGSHPLLAIASAASAWMARKREDCRQLALLAAYLVAIQCLMPVQENYFVPAWPLIAVLASGLLAFWTRPASERSSAMSGAAAGALFAPLLLAQACVLAAVCVYPGRAGEKRALDRELAKDPNDPWMRSARGMALLREGRAAEAAGDLARAYALDPKKDREIEYAWALLAEDAPGAILWENLTPEADGMLSGLRAPVLRAVYLALKGRRGEAAAALESARNFERSNGASSSALPQVVLEIVSSWPAAKRPAIVEFFLDAADSSALMGSTASAKADMFLNLAAAAGRLDGRGTALRCLALAEDLPLDPETARRVSFAYRDLGRFDRALNVLKRSEPNRPEDIRSFMDLAVRAEQSNQPKTALESLAAAEGSIGPGNAAAARASDGNLDDDVAHRLAGLYQENRDYVRALKVVNLRVRARPGDARWRNDRGVLRWLMGDRDGAAADLRSAIALDPGLLEAYLSLGSLNASRNRRREALEILQKGLARPRTKDDEEIARRIRAERERILSAPARP